MDSKALLHKAEALGEEVHKLKQDVFSGKLGSQEELENKAQELSEVSTMLKSSLAAKAKQVAAKEAAQKKVDSDLQVQAAQMLHEGLALAKEVKTPEQLIDAKNMMIRAQALKLKIADNEEAKKKHTKLADSPAELDENA